MAMDFLSGAAPPAPAGAPSPIPPDLAGALGAGGPPPPPPPPDSGPPGGQPTDEGDALDAILQAIADYINLPTVDEQERLTAEKMSTLAQQLKAGLQKMSDQTMGANPAMRKALGGP